MRHIGLMSGTPRLRELVHAALCVAVVVAACMPERVEVGRDSTLEVFTAGEGGTSGMDAPRAPAGGGTSAAEGGETSSAGGPS